MFRIHQVAFQQHLLVGEGGGRFATCPFQGAREFLRRFNQPHTLAPAPGGSLDQQWKPKLTGGGREYRIVLVVVLIAGNHRRARRRHQALGLHLGTHGADGGARGADEGDPRIRARLGEVRVLGQETIAWVDRIGGVLARDADHLVDAQIGLDRPHSPADRIGLVGLEAVQREAVLPRIDRDRHDAELDGGAKHTDGDFAPVGDQEPAEMGLRLVDHNAPLRPPGASAPLVRAPAADRTRSTLAHPSGTSRNAMKDTSPTRVTKVAPA